MQSRFQYLNEISRSAQTIHHRALDTSIAREVEVCRYYLNASEIPTSRHLLEVTAALKHPHLETILEVGQDDEGLFSVIEATEGETLLQMLQPGPLTMEEFHQITPQILTALSALHEASESHLALKPEFIRVRRLGGGMLDARIVGFGETLRVADAHGHRCAAPEYWNGTALGRRTDVYALGCILYEMLSGQPAFVGSTIEAIRGAHLKNEFVPLAQLARHAPPWISSWVTKLLTPNDAWRLRNITQALELYQMAEDSLPATQPRNVLTSHVPSFTATHYVGPRGDWR
jgi:eukaryotic-like serine/threonine-protein kinase